MALTKVQIDLINELTWLKLNNKQLREALQDLVYYHTVGEDRILDTFIEKAKKLLKTKQ